MLGTKYFINESTKTAFKCFNKYLRGRFTSILCNIKTNVLICKKFYKKISSFDNKLISVKKLYTIQFQKLDEFT